MFLYMPNININIMFMDVIAFIMSQVDNMNLYVRRILSVPKNGSQQNFYGIGVSYKGNDNKLVLQGCQKCYGKVSFVINKINDGENVT